MAPLLQNKYVMERYNSKVVRSVSVVESLLAGHEEECSSYVGTLQTICYHINNEMLLNIKN